MKLKNASPKRIIILGFGGNCIDIADTIDDINNQARFKKYEVLGFLDDSPHDDVLGPLTDWEKYPNCFFVNGIGSTKTFHVKENILRGLNIPPEKYETIIHPSVSVSKSSVIGFGTVLFQNVVVTSNAVIGNHVMILPNSVVSHNTTIGDYCVIAGCVCISGNVTIKKSCYLGSNSSVKDGIMISQGCLIGCGSNVVKDTEPGNTLIGNPAIPMEKK